MKKHITLFLLIITCFGYKYTSGQILEKVTCVGGTLSDSKGGVFAAPFLTSDKGYLLLSNGVSRDHDFTNSNGKLASLVVKITNAGNERFRYLINDNGNDIQWINIHKEDTINRYYEIHYLVRREKIDTTANLFSNTLFNLKLDYSGSLLSLDSTNNLHDYYYEGDAYPYDNIVRNTIRTFNSRFSDPIQEICYDYVNNRKYTTMCFLNTFENGFYRLYKGKSIHPNLAVVATYSNNGVRIAKKSNAQVVSKSIDTILSNSYVRINQFFEQLTSDRFIFNVSIDGFGTPKYYKHDFYIFDTNLNVIKNISCKSEGFDTLTSDAQLTVTNLQPISKNGTFIIYGRSTDRKPLVKCFDSDGTLLWSYKSGRTASFKSFIDIINDSILVLNYTPSSVVSDKREGLVLISSSGRLIVDYLMTNIVGSPLLSSTYVKPNNNNFWH